MNAVRSKSRFCSRKAALTVEMALCLPVLFTLLFGCYETAKAHFLRHAADNAAYEAARAGIVPGASPENCVSRANMVMRSLGVSNFTVNVTPSTLERSTETVVVDVQVPVSGNTLLAPIFLGSQVFNGHCQMKRETL